MELIHSNDAYLNQYHKPGCDLFSVKNADSRMLAFSMSHCHSQGFHNPHDFVGIHDTEILSPNVVQAAYYLEEDRIAKSTPGHRNYLVIGQHLLSRHQSISGMFYQKYAEDKHIIANGFLLNWASISHIFTHCPPSACFSSNYLRYQVVDNIDTLSVRESQTLYYAIRGLSQPMIANKLNLSPRTIETYYENLKYKLGIYHKAELLEYALAYGYEKYLPWEILDPLKKIHTLVNSGDAHP